VIDGEVKDQVELARPHPELGMVVDFSRLKEVVDGILPDHLVLNASPLPFTSAAIDPASQWEDEMHQPIGLENPTAENLAVHLFVLLAPRLAIVGAILRQVRVWETPDADVSYPAEIG
jgi:6-pyruvoyl-tetrahydropterin synthase